MKHFIIVGATSGIGFNLTKKLSVNHKVTALSRTAGSVNELPNTTHFALDITSDSPEFPSINEPIDGIIYCPGSILLKPFKALKNEDFLNDFHINVLGAVKTIRNYLPQLLQAESPSIILFSTVAAQTGMPFHSSIAAAKGAIEGLTKCLAAEFAPKIRVNAIAPSLTQTPLADKLLNAEAKLKAAEGRHPLKRIGQPDDIADAALYLLNASWVTGQILHVDGGMSTLK
jgi:NAD(P)-dependent dehydrogenase (short-subunit alcohol dehydrogenase family)